MAALTIIRTTCAVLTLLFNVANGSELLERLRPGFDAVHVVFSTRRSNAKNNLADYSGRCNDAKLIDLAYTLGLRLTKFAQRILAAVHKESLESDIKIGTNDVISFSGQAVIPAFAFTETLMTDPEATSLINEPDYSQPVCTAVQIALVELLDSWGVKQAATIGYSSGVVGCHNPPSSATLSGDSKVIEELKKILDGKNIFARVLKTGGKAYQSHHMKAAAARYEAYLHSIPNTSASNTVKIPMVSTFRSEHIIDQGKSIPNSYWVNNLVSPDLFQEGVQHLLIPRDQNGFLRKIRDIRGIGILMAVKIEPLMLYHLSISEVFMVLAKMSKHLTSKPAIALRMENVFGALRILEAGEKVRLPGKFCISPKPLPGPTVSHTKGIWFHHSSAPRKHVGGSSLKAISERFTEYLVAEIACTKMAASFNNEWVELSDLYKFWKDVVSMAALNALYGAVSVEAESNSIEKWHRFLLERTNVMDIEPDGD
ncbi:hypothetical protein DL764_007053 [Monosporascus ibericus]|uniref:Malonyl-CoA:ACP transacylase (MAT) domain-containing protein n=1 Tax=Monosporascus ibericus TaxID=155417 RepID=A0A4Q4T3G6_9PEZI|nr:hypothetical protein DL764_007053 [Monosporascus ibericus]